MTRVYRDISVYKRPNKGEKVKHVDTFETQLTLEDRNTNEAFRSGTNVTEMLIRVCWDVERGTQLREM
ncbi:unnamed protein product [Brugia pahangi]|uniref:Kinesin motor domain-containing protein n=1 Tax=Brugia pahangi TaxID=6280 RepID=A0A0N4T267_BRUPA|nr:unnamed protein product [Brugia pahangi]